MKNNYLNRSALFLLVLLLAGLSVSIESCKKISENIKLIIDPKLTKAQFSVQFVDAVTQQPIGMDGGPSVSIKIAGRDADMVYEVSGKQKQSYTASKGLITLGIDPDAFSSGNQVLIFTIMAEAEGYIPNSYNAIVPGDHNQLIKLSMVNKANLPSGVVMIKDEELTASNGSIGSNSTISTPTIEGENVRASLTIDEGSILKDRNGSSLNGQLVTEIFFFSCVNNEALAAFPGGLVALDLQREGSTFSTLFASAGFISIEITDETGRKAEHVEGTPLTLEMGVPEQTYNPFTNATVSVGDTIPFWRMDSEQGNWTYISTNAIKAIPELVYEVSLDHLTLFNIDWPERNLDPETLDENSTVTMWGIQNEKSTNGLSNGDQLFLNYRLRKQTDNTVITESFLIATIGSTDTLINSVCGYPIIFELFTNSQSITYETSEFCGYHEIDLSAFNILSGVGTVVINIYGQCAGNPDLEVRPSVGYYYKNLSQANSNWMMGFTEQGTTSIAQVNFGDTYLFGINIEDEWHEYTFIFAEDQYDFYIDLPSSFCLE